MPTNTSNLGQAPSGPTTRSHKTVNLLFRVILGRDPDRESLSYFSEQLDSGLGVDTLVEQFLNCEEYRKKTQVKFSSPPGHFYSPIVATDDIVDHVEANERAALSPEISGINVGRADMVGLWHELLPYLETIPFPAEKNSTFRFWFNNPAYSWADASILHAMIRRFHPRRIIEVGSGWSSACTLETIDRYIYGGCDLTFIEPYPKLLETLLGPDKSRVKIIPSPIQKVPLELFDELQAGDILFIDSTHVLKTGSDVCHELFEILPRLSPGVIVHIHDVFWPFEYPRSWVLEENRSWNELYALRALLTNNSHWKILMFNDYFARFERPLIQRTYPNFLTNTGGALWLQRTED